jgi:tubulin epsilon
MNGVAASLLLGVTSSVRFEGSLNVDLNEITNNLASPSSHSPFLYSHLLTLLLSNCT